MNIGIFTHYDEVMRPVADMTVPVMQKYCDKHGYEFTALTHRLSDRRIVWDKIPLLLQNWDSAAWLLYLDADILLTNHTITLESIIQSWPEMDAILGTDINGLNFGAFLLRSCDWCRDYLIRAWAKGDLPDTTSEQDGLIKALLEDLTGARVGRAAQSDFNSYPYEMYGHSVATPGNWEPDHFAMHLPGMTAERRIEVFSEYLKEIIW